MECYYYIKLANGGEIRLPANFVPLVNTDDDLVDLIENYQKSLTEETTEEYKEDLKKYLIAAKTGLSTNTIEALLNRYAKNYLEVSATTDDFIDLVNERLSKNSSVKDFYKILQGKTWNKNENYTYIKDGDSKKITTREFLAFLKQPVRLKYLDSIKAIGLLGVHSIKDIKEELKIQESLKIDVGSNPIIEESLLKIISSTFNVELFKKDSFYALDYSGDAGDSMLIYPIDSKDPLIFYNKDNPISLFLSIYKFLASEIPPQNLAQLLAVYNEENKTNITYPETQEDVRHFFNGSFEEGNYIEGDFDFLIKSKSGTTFMTTGLLEATLDAWKEKISKTGIGNIRTSVFALTPYVSKSKAYISEFGKFIEEEEKYFKKEVTHARTWLKNNFDIVDRYLSNKNYYYSENKEVSFNTIEDAYAWLDSNIIYKQDIIKLKRGKIDYFVIPTDFIQRGDTIQVQGFTQKNGKFEQLKKEDLDLEDIKKIVYRTLDSKNPDTGEMIANEGKDAIIVYVDKEKEGHTAVLAASIIKETARIGSVISYLKADGTISYDKNTVTEVLPAGLKIGEYLIHFNKITSISTDKNFYIDSEFTDAETEQKLQVLKKYKKINKKTGRFMHMETGDLIVQIGDTRKYNKVVGVSGNTAYILIKSTIKENGEATENFQYRVSGVKRNNIGELYKKTIYAPKLPTDVGIALKDFKDNKSIKTHNYSFFDNYGEARKEDYFLLNNNTYQIIDREHNIFAKFTLSKGEVSLEYSQLHDINKSNVIFATNRNISSKDADSINELNNKHLHITKPPGKKGVIVKEAVYILPKNVDIEEARLLDSGSLSLGYSAEKAYIKKAGLEKNEKDVTKEVAEKIAEKTGEETDGKLWINTKGEYYTKFNAKLFQTKFSDLSESDKSKYIQNNSFIFFKNNTKDPNLRNKTFRVANVSDEKLSIEYSRYSRLGEMVTIKKSINKEEAFKDIEWLYLYRGHSRIPELQRAQDKRTKKNKRDLVGNIAVKFGEVFGIPTTIIKTSPKGKTTKKAWIAVKANPKVVINLGNENTDDSDVVHEYMHLFLFALKTKKLLIYENLIYEFRNKKINQIINIEKKTKKMLSDLEALKSGDLTIIEEFLVEELSIFMAGQLDYTSLSEESFISAFSEAVKELGYEEIDLDVSMFDILGMKMEDIFINVESKLVKNGLIMFEANFREWITEEIENNDMKLNCG